MLLAKIKLFNNDTFEVVLDISLLSQKIVDNILYTAQECNCGVAPDRDTIIIHTTDYYMGLLFLEKLTDKYSLVIL